MICLLYHWIFRNFSCLRPSSFLKTKLWCGFTVLVNWHLLALWPFWKTTGTCTVNSQNRKIPISFDPTFNRQECTGTVYRLAQPVKNIAIYRNHIYRCCGAGADGLATYLLEAEPKFLRRLRLCKFVENDTKAVIFLIKMSKLSFKKNFVVIYLKRIFWLLYICLKNNTWNCCKTIKWPEQEPELGPEPKFLTSWNRSRTKMDRRRNTDTGIYFSYFIRLFKVAFWSPWLIAEKN
jgi:hypothetical protein